MTAHSAVVAVFDHHHQAEEAVKKLADAGIEITKVNIVGKSCHTEEKVVGFYNAMTESNSGENRAPSRVRYGLVCRRLVHDRTDCRPNRGTRSPQRYYSGHR